MDGLLGFWWGCSCIDTNTPPTKTIVFVFEISFKHGHIGPVTMYRKANTVVMVLCLRVGKKQICFGSFAEHVCLYVYLYRIDHTHTGRQQVACHMRHEAWTKLNWITKEYCTLQVRFYNFLKLIIWKSREVGISFLWKLKLNISKTVQLQLIN